MKTFISITSWLFVVSLIVLFAPMWISGIILRLAFGFTKFGWDWTDDVISDVLERVSKK